MTFDQCCWCWYVLKDVWNIYFLGSYLNKQVGYDQSHSTGLYNASSKTLENITDTLPDASMANTVGEKPEWNKE